MSRIHVIIAAAGTGSRFGAEVPKQFTGLGGRPLLMTTIDRLRQMLPGASMSLVLDRQYNDLWTRLCDDYGCESPEVIVGGATRYHSVRNAVEALPSDAEIVLIHDGVRPLVSYDVVDGVLQALETHTGAIPAVPCTDSLRHSTDHGATSQPVDRSQYWAVQTPQGFHAQALKEAYAQEGSSHTDDASLLNDAGYADVVLTPGDPSNIKITYPIDLQIASMLLHASDDA